MADFRIDYDFVLSRAPSKSMDETIVFLSEELPYNWHGSYREMVGAPAAVYRFSDGHFEYLFDDAAELVRLGLIDSSNAQEDRAVVAFGRSHSPTAERNKSWMRRFLRGLSNHGKGDTDRGHMAAHAAGGGVDVNIFPQQSDLNRGRSEEGKIFREMERYCAGNLGTFFFLRLIYADPTWWPTEIEFGLLREDLTFWVERFSNL